MFRQTFRSCNRLFTVRRQSSCIKIQYSHLHQKNILQQKLSEVIFQSKRIACRQISTTCCTRDNHHEVVEPTTRRLVNPDQIDGEKYVESLCLRLLETQPDRYGFFTALVNKRTLSSNTNEEVKEKRESFESVKADDGELFELLTLFGEDQIEQKCLEKFQSWADKSKLNIAYSLYANNLKCDNFLTRLVRHMASQVESLMPEELVAMLIVIYLQKSWTPEDLYDVLDPTALQDRLAELIVTREMTNGEVCAACHGLKKIEGFVAKETGFRIALYNRATIIARFIAANAKATPIENMTLLHIAILLHQGNLVVHDEGRMIHRLLRVLIPAANLLDMRTAVKMMTFGLVKNIHNPTLSSKVLSRITNEGDIAFLSLRDLCGLLKFIVLIDLDQVLDNEEKCILLDSIVEELNLLEDVNCRLPDVTDLLQSWHYLSQFNYYETDKLKDIFAAINGDLLPQAICQMSRDEMSQKCLLAAYRSLFPRSYEQSQAKEEFKKSVVKNFIRNVTSLDQTLAIFKPEFKTEFGLRPDLLDSLLPITQSSVPALRTSQANQVANRNPHSKRHRLFTSLYKELAVCLGGDSYVKFVHVLPHFQEPDIVFGHLAGIKLSLPDSMTDPSSSLKIKAAPEVGEWFVITAEYRYITDTVHAFQDHPFPEMVGIEKIEKFQTGAVAEPFRHRQLRALGYNVISISDDVYKTGIREWVNKVVASVLTGLNQGPPKHRSTPTM